MCRFVLGLITTWGLAQFGAGAAETSPVFTDTDGDTYQIVLAGPGEFDLTRTDTGGGNGPIASITLTGTTFASALSVKVTALPGGTGPDIGKVAIGKIAGVGAASLGSLNAPKSDLTGAGIALGGGLGTVKLANIASGADVIVGLDAKLKTTSLTAGAIGAIEVTTPAPTFKLTARSLAGAKFKVAAVTSFQVTSGNAVADLEAAGRLVALSVKGGNFTGHLDADTIGSIRVTKTGAVGGSITDSFITARSIGTVLLDGDLANSYLLAGADFGADREPGGSGANGDTFAAGSLKSFLAKGHVTNSIIGAGYTPVDGVFKDSNDGVIGGALSRIGSVTVRGTFDGDSLLAAGFFPARVSFGPFLDLHFISHAVVVPAAPVAPPLDPTVAVPAATATAFLYSGSNPVQTGVAPGTIEPARASVLRGRVLTRGGAPLAGVQITILDHPEFGETHSRSDGMFDLVTNGGGTLVAKYAAAGFIPVQRQVAAAAQDFCPLPDVVMIGYDPLATTVQFGPASPFQTHTASSQSDPDGARRVLLIFHPGTTANLVLPDGTLQPAASLKVRATEFTVGATGPAAMSAVLPPNSAYTYCVELSADEAKAAGAVRVDFNQPATFYLENFLALPVGIDVPVGFYDRVKGEWKAGESGLIVKVVGETGGAADLDVTGDGVADTGAALTALGITNAERAQVAASYNPGQSLWRVPILQFEDPDMNYPGSPGGPGNAPAVPPPRQPPPDYDTDPPAYFVQSQRSFERVPLAGVPFALNYHSNRVSGYRTANRLRIPVSGAVLTGAVQSIELEVAIAGRTFTQPFAAAPNLVADFEWDGLDAYGRPVPGTQPATIKITNFYPGVYQGTRRFGVSGEFVMAGNPTRMLTGLSTQYTVQLGNIDIRRQTVGGWTLDPHHIYDSTQRRLYQGDGTVRSVGSVNNRILTIAGSGQDFTGFDNHGIPARQGRFQFPFGLAFAPDGSFVFADPPQHRLYRVGTDGVLRTVAGTGVAGFSGDGGLAASAQINNPEGVALGRDGTIYFSDFGNNRLRAISPAGLIRTFAGTGMNGFSGDEGPATAALLRPCVGLSVGPDGTVYIADTNNHRVRAVSTDGLIRTIAGTGTNGFNGDDILATTADLSFPQGACADLEGNVFIADTGNRTVRRIGADGIIRRFAGLTGQAGDPTAAEGDGGPALSAKLHSPVNVLLDGAGTLFITDPGARKVRKVTRDGTIVGVAGSGEAAADPSAPNGEGGAALQAPLGALPGPQGAQYAALAPDGTIVIADSANRRIRKLAQPLPGFTADELAVPSADGAQLFRFSAAGRHLDTRDTFTGAVRFTFTYEADGQLAKITDGDGNVTAIQRTAGGAPLAVIGPFGHRTTLTTDANGSLASVRDPLGGTYAFVCNPGGLLLSDTDPAGQVTTFAYDALGRLTRADFAGSPADDLARVDLPAGHFVTVATALGVVEKYQVETMLTGDELRANTDAANLVTTALRRANGMETFTEPSGLITSVTLGPDARFALQAPLETKRSVATPGGRLLTLQTAQAVTLSDPENPLSLTAFTETFTVNGQAFTRTYAPATRTFTETSPLGRPRTRQINAQARAIRRQFADLNPRTFTYDARGRLIVSAAGAGVGSRTAKLAYDAKGRLASFTNPFNEITRLGFDAAGRFIRLTAADGGVLTLGRDAAGRISAVTPPGRAAHLLGYDPNGQLASHTPPGAAATTWSYNADAFLAQIARPGGAAVAFGYDAADRLITRTLAAGATAFAYDATTGNLSTITMPGGDILALAYDGPVPTGATWSGAVTGSVTRTLDNDLRTASQSVNGASTVAFSYDLDGLLTAVGALTLTRDSRGFATATALGGVTDTRVRNGFGELASYVAKFGPATIFSQQHTRDKMGRIVQTVESFGAASDTFDYVYDAAGRLTDVAKNGAHTAYTYDANGNRLAANGVAASYDGQDRVTQSGTTAIAHNANGDLLAKTAASQTASYTYDALGNLTAVALPGGPQIDYVLDGRNRRLGKRVNGALVRGFLYQDQLRIVAELDGSNAVVSRFVYGDRANAPAYLVTGAGTFRLLCDARGSVRLVVNSADGTIAQRLDYDAFGNVLADTAPGFQPFGFAGGLYDPDTKLVRFGRRDYDAETGRWTARDPILFAGGDANLYAYVSNDPVNRIDPAGTRSYDNEDNIFNNDLGNAPPPREFGPPPPSRGDFPTEDDYLQDAYDRHKRNEKADLENDLGYDTAAAVDPFGAFLWSGL